MATTGSWHVLVRGRVQGVGFRWFARERARALGLVGWVCNRADGSVEILAGGELEQLEQFKATIKRGPRGALVEQTEDLSSDEKPEGDSFEILR